MKTKFSIIIPTYKSKDYLDLCLYSISRIPNIKKVCEVIVSCDGHFEIVKETIMKYVDALDLSYLNPPKVGMAKAINYGAYKAKYEHLLIINDDNVVPLNLGSRLQDIIGTKKDCVISFPQIEPKPSIFFCHYIEDLGETFDTFDINSFNRATDLRWASPKGKSSNLNLKDVIRLPFDINEHYFEKHLGTFPFLISKESFMKSGGFDSDYNSPFVTDWDFFVKFDGKCWIDTNLYFYHFSPKSSASPEVKQTEQQAHEYFKFKWGRYGKINKEQTSYLG